MSPSQDVRGKQAIMQMLEISASGRFRTTLPAAPGHALLFHASPSRACAYICDEVGIYGCCQGRAGRFGCNSMISNI
jgi:hypothetical protein